MAYKINTPKDEYKQSWSYTPGSAVKDNGNGTYTTSGGLTFKNNYTADKVTPGMSYAIKQAGGDPTKAGAADDYVEKLMGRIGTRSANGDYVLSAADIQKELNRLGYKANGAGNDWMTVGSQQYLVGGDEYNKLKSTLNDIGRGDMNIYNGQNLNGVTNYVGNGNSSSGNLGYSSYMDSYAKALQQQLDRIDEQKRLATENADREKRQAYVAMKLGQKSLNEQNAASGLQDSGYSEQGNIALTADYGNNLNTISNNYQQYLNDLAGTYADTALSGAGTLADMYQQDYQNRLAAQKYADQMAQQQLENQWYEREWAAQQAQNQQELNYNQAKTKADAAMSLGIWSPEIENVYGVTQAEYQNYLRSLELQAYGSGGSTRSGSRGNRGGSGGDSGYGDGYIDDNVVDDQPPKPKKVTKAATVQNSQAAQRTNNARNSYADEIKSIEKKYGLSTAGATEVRDTMRREGMTADEALRLLRANDTAADVARRLGISTADAASLMDMAKASGLTVDELYAMY